MEMLLERNPEYRTSLAFLQVAVPSRDHDVHRWVAEQLADIASRGAKLSRQAGTETGAGATGGPLSRRPGPGPDFSLVRAMTGRGGPPGS